MENKVHLKDGTKKVFYIRKKIDTDSFIAYHRKIKATQEEIVLFNAFYYCKP